MSSHRVDLVLPFGRALALGALVAGCDPVREPEDSAAAGGQDSTANADSGDSGVVDSGHVPPELTNPSFEAPAVDPGNTAQGAEGWTLTGYCSVQTYHPDAGYVSQVDPLAPPADGGQLLHVDCPLAGEQQVSQAFAVRAGQRYSANAAFLRRNTDALAPLATAGLALVGEDGTVHDEMTLSGPGLLLDSTTEVGVTAVAERDETWQVVLRFVADASYQQLAADHVRLVEGAGGT